eukprot:1626365-Rhodomonas_salina.5
MRERESVNTTTLAVLGNVRSSSRRAAASGRRELTSPSIGSATASTGERSTASAATSPPSPCQHSHLWQQHPSPTTRLHSWLPAHE